MPRRPETEARRRFMKLAAGAACAPVMAKGWSGGDTPTRAQPSVAGQTDGGWGEGTAVLDHQRLAGTHFGNDAPWYLDNIPFFEASDARITQIYYYRWQVFRAHIRDLGERGHVFTEFLDAVPWDRKPFSTLNDSAIFPIHDGRWLRDRRYVDQFIDYLYEGGGNDRHFSEAIADAVHAHFLVHGDTRKAVRHLAAMKHVFNLWDDHYDFDKHLYWIEPLLDATEYTIASIDASGGMDGFTGGQAFRPSINTYMYANAKAISRLCTLDGDDRSAAWYAQRASDLGHHLVDSLWNPRLEHFTDRYQVSNQYVHYWDFIRGRELVGFLPWYAGLPPDHGPYARAWRHLLSSSQLRGAHGMRTVEPSYAHYMQQYRYDRATGQPECQWNGPAWPFQTAQALTGMANLLNDYRQDVVTRSDYVMFLRQFADLHMREGRPDIQEDYDPDTGKVIVGLSRSHHYYHSSFVDLVINGLVGVRPGEGDALVIHPLVPADPADTRHLSYFILENVPVRGHLLTVLWDADGQRYGRGAGLSVFVDGRRVAHAAHLRKLALALPARAEPPARRRVNRAVNVSASGYPKPSASRNNVPSNMFSAVDGRLWFFKDMARGWTVDAGSREDWFALEFEAPVTLDAMEASFLAEGKHAAAPDGYEIQYRQDGRWRRVHRLDARRDTVVANGVEAAQWKAVTTRFIRIVMRHRAPLRLVEWRLFSPATGGVPLDR